jgi:hypothetical protein
LACGCSLLGGGGRIARRLVQTRFQFCDLRQQKTNDDLRLCRLTGDPFLCDFQRHATFIAENRFSDQINSAKLRVQAVNGYCDMNELGWVSIWAFMKQGTPVDDVLRDVFAIDNYDIDSQDVVGEEDWRVLPINELIERLSFSHSFAEPARRRAEACGIHTATRLLAQYDFRYDPNNATPPALDDPVFIGAFPYHM